MPPAHVAADDHAPTRDLPLAALWRTRSYLRPYLGRLIFMLAAAGASVGAEIVIPLLTKAIIDGAISHGNRELLLLLGLAATALGVIEALLNLLRRWVQARAVTGMEMAMRDDLYAHLQRLQPGFHDEWQSGQLLSRATTDLSATRRSQDQQGDLATYVEEAAAGIRVLKALGRRGEAAARHTGQARLVYGTQVSKARLRGSFWAFLDLIPNAAIGLIVLLGAIATSQHALTLGGLVAFITLTLELVWPIEAMGYSLASGQEAATAAQRVYEILDTEPAITDPPVRAAPAPRTPARLVFDRVEFGYPGARPVLRGVCLELEPGKTLALTGATGAGKTTLLQLVPRLADPAAGRVTLDGTDIRALPLAALRAQVGCAFEEATLFSASVRENVSFGAPDATDGEIEQALAAAQAGFVHDLPWGLDTRIGEQGMTLSGGQRQRIALARAILARPSVLILDDPLSALDVHTEEKVSRALREVLAGTTALIVAHRPSTVALTDRVALLADGVVAALGTHAELLRSQPRYRDLMSGAAGEGAPGEGGAAGEKVAG